MPKPSVCLKVPKLQGQTALGITNQQGLTDKGLLIQKDNSGSLCVPFLREPTEGELAILRAKVPEFELATMVFVEKKQREKTLPEALADKLPPHLLACVPRALDAVGDIAIIEIPPELEIHKAAVGEAVLEVHRNVRVVLAKAGKISGTFRLRDFEFLAGEHRTVTVYREHGCVYEVDVAKAYFSPRLGTEHQRVAVLVGEGEVVVDLFAGVGPFAVPIAKRQPTAKVYAIDINADAVEMLKKNARLNRVEAKIFPITGDAREVVDERLAGTADRVIMNLPETASEFIDVACKAIKPGGGIVHFYGFVRLPRTIEDMQQEFSQAVEKSGRYVEAFTCCKMVRETAPFEWQAVLDAKIR
jgi:tRNA (guanine37-N1)-methyltransferase